MLKCTSFEYICFSLKNTKDTRKAFASAAAYVRDVENRVVSKEGVDGKYVFASILVGAPADQYGKRLVIKTYTKMTVGEEEFTVYGYPMVESYYSLATKLNGDENLPGNVQEIINGIVDRVENGTSDDNGDIGMGGDDLWD